jgi:hypothetical protein
LRDFLDPHLLIASFSPTIPTRPNPGTDSTPSRASLKTTGNVEIDRQIDALEYNSAATYNADLWEALKSTSTDVEPAFRRDPKVLRGKKDQTESGWDWILAEECAQVDWPPQEILNLLIMSRRMYGGEMKKLGSLRATIRNAYTNYIQKETLRQAVELQDSAASAEDLDELRSAALATLSNALQVPITRIVRYMTKDPTFLIRTELGDVHIDNVSIIVRYDRFVDRWAAITRIVLSPNLRKSWHIYAQLILDACEDDEVGEENSWDGELRWWLEMYLTEHRPNPKLNEAAMEHDPWIDADMNVWISQHGLAEFLKVKRIMLRDELAPRLKQIGAERHNKPYIRQNNRD